MTPEQHKQFSEACTAFGEALEKIFCTESPTMERQQQLVFTTADFAEVKEGDEIYVIAYEIGQIAHCRAGVGLDYSFYYSTREAAEKVYSEWLFDQPVLTLSDLEFKGLTGKMRDELKRIVKDKIAKR